ncbi:teicoplanin resistance protein VanZ [Chryseobacterium phosphatilyticum]|uniref:Teicoplanin resistance protein VanZ n=1 Tax=Chryseobacterium phosphatilyticum TaxID=475075 RepID=A0A316XFK8_9FLAO|nr:VanZ family protein [Chryseobacterium phosphatilyticum]PWN70198.1 teicoplanin resistance protein VanZ [Chryseobacterium phosphatilyticum]
MLKKFYKIIIIPYGLFLLYLMFLGMGRFQYEDNLITVEPVFSTIKFIQGTQEWKSIIMIVLGNVVMFIPFGFLGWIFPGLRKLKPLLFTFISAIVIVEALQYFTRMGIFEVDDIILNTFGVYTGWMLCRWIEKRIIY